MKKFYVIGITRYNDGTKDSYSITSWENLKEAKKIYHQKLQVVYSTENLASGLVQIIDDYGTVLASEFYQTPAEGTED